MENQYFTSRHPAIQLLMFALIVLISVLGVMILSLLVGIAFIHIPPAEWLNLANVKDPEWIPVLKFLQITQSLSMFVIPPIVFGWFMIRNPWNFLGIDKKPDQKLLLVVVALAVAILPVLNLLGVINQGLQLPGFLAGIEEWMKRSEEQAAEITEAFLSVNSFGGYLINVLMVVLIAAFGEEFFFRGVLQKVFQKWFSNPHVAIIFVAIIFSAFHMQFYGFLPRFALGVLFGYLFYWSGNIWYPILAHGINNFLPVTLTYFLRDQFDPAELDKVGTGPEAWIWAAPAVLLSTVAIVYFYKNTNNKNQITNKLQ